MPTFIKRKKHRTATKGTKRNKNTRVVSDSVEIATHSSAPSSRSAATHPGGAHVGGAEIPVYGLSHTISQCGMYWYTLTRGGGGGEQRNTKTWHALSSEKKKKHGTRYIGKKNSCARWRDNTKAFGRGEGGREETWIIHGQKGRETDNTLTAQQQKQQQRTRQQILFKQHEKKLATNGNIFCNGKQQTPPRSTRRYSERQQKTHELVEVRLLRTQPHGERKALGDLSRVGADEVEPDHLQ